MRLEHDISNMAIDEIEKAVSDYDPFDPGEAPGWHRTNAVPPQAEKTDEEMFSPEFPIEEKSDEEMNQQPPLQDLKPYNRLSDDAKMVGRGIYKTLGALAWPFERIEAGLATPATALIKAISPVLRMGVDRAMTPMEKEYVRNTIKNNLTDYAKSRLGNNVDAAIEDLAEKSVSGMLSKDDAEALTQIKTALPEIIPAIFRGAKSFVPFTRNDPEKVKGFNDFWAGYYKGWTGEDAPEWFSQTTGAASSFVIPPLALGKGLRMARGAYQASSLGKYVASKQIPDWDFAKLTRKANIFERNERAYAAGELLADKEAARIAHQLQVEGLSKNRPVGVKTGEGELRVGRTVDVITPDAIKKRFGQMMKSSITEQAIMSEAVSPMQAELTQNFERMKKIGIATEENYLQKLTAAQVYALRQQQKLKLTTALAKKFGFEIVFSPKSKTVGGALGYWDMKGRIIRVASGGRPMNEVIDTLAHEITHKLHGDIAGDMALQMTKLGGGKYKNRFDALTKALIEERQEVYKLLGMDYKALEQGGGFGVPGTKGWADYYGKPTEVLARVGTMLKRNPEAITAVAPKTVKEFKAFLKENPTWDKFFATKQMAPWTLQDVAKVRTGVKNPLIKQLLTESHDIEKRIYASEIYGGTGYMPRMYEEIEAATGKPSGFGVGGPKVKASQYLRRRKDLSAAERKELGEITEPAFPTIKRAIQEDMDIETEQLFAFASSRGEWVSETPRVGLYPEPLPSTKGYGSLAGMYVHPKIYHDVKDIIGVRSNIEAIYDAVIGSWKVAKVTLSPAWHFRNTFTNTILLDLSGTDHAAQAKLIVQAAGEIKSGSAEYNTARKYFKSTTFVQGELLDDILRIKKGDVSGIQQTVNIWNTAFEKTVAPATKLYQNEEFIFKFVKYLEQRGMGMSVQKSVVEANKWMFDYSDLSHFEKTYMRRIMPFYCVPDDTEILTRKGWRTRSQIQKGDMALTYNVGGDYTEWEPIKDISVFDFQGNLCSISSGKGGANKWRFTDEHRFPVIGWKNKRQILPFNELKTTHRIPLARPLVANAMDSIPKRELAVLSWVVTDGYFRWRGNSCEMVIYQSPGKYLSEIRGLLGSDLSSESIHPLTGVHCLRIKGGLVKKLTMMFRDKSDFAPIVCGLSPDSLLLVYDVMVKAEGCLPVPTLSGSGRKRMTNVLFAQNKGPILDAFQIVCQLLGKPFQINSRGGNVKRKTNLCVKDVRVGYEYYNGNVWCPQTHNQTWVMRQNGKVIITGNTFPRKALPRVLEAAADRPLTLAKYPLIAWSAEKWALHNLSLTDRDYDQIQKVLPEQMKTGGYMLMPFRDANGDLQFFDWTYIVPWGEMFDAQDRGLIGSTVTNPMFQVVADLTRNRSGFSGRDIYLETDTDEEKTFKKMVYMWQVAVPSLMYKGIYWDKLYNAATGKPSKMGKVPHLGPAIAHTIFGARTTPIDVEQQRIYRLQEVKAKASELQNKLADITIREANGNITRDEYTKKRDQYIKQIEQLTSSGVMGAGTTDNGPEVSE